MRISTMLDYAGDVRATADRAVELERAGVDVVWVAEAYGFDAVSLLGYLAATTERIGLGSAILNTYSRTPAALAQTAAGLDALSGGRFTLGLGASGPQVVEGFHGVPYDRPLTRTSEIIDICRAAWRREPLVHDGRVFHLPLPPGEGTGLGKPLKLINHPVRAEIPIHVAALGAKSVELCAAKADGWIPFMFIPDHARTVWGDALDAGLAARPAELGPLDIVAGGLVAIGPHAEAAAARDKVRPMLALYIGGMGAKGKNFYNDVCRAYGYEREADEIQDLYLSGQKAEAAALVPAEMLELASLCGDEAFVAERLAAYRAAGVTTLNVTPVGPDPAATLRTLRELVG
jgi:F420-dependent oxidoreductase-like protein